MSHRVVRGLKWAREAEKAPFGKPRGRGAKRFGINYEKALAKALPQALNGVWYEFCDSAGMGFAQPDLITQLDETLIVLEAKYTWVPEAQTQINLLYKPILEMVHGQRVVGIVVCKALVPGIRAPITGNFEEAIRLALGGASPVFQWLGVGPLFRNSAPKSVAHPRAIAVA